MRLTAHMKQVVEEQALGFVAPFSLLVPISGMISSSLLLGETFVMLRLLGAALVICGLALAVYRRRK